MNDDGVKWNLQQHLETMEETAVARHNTLVLKFDNVLEKVNDHETRIVVVEGTRKTVKWLGMTVGAALILAAIDLAFSHLPSLLANVKP